MTQTGKGTPWKCKRCDYTWKQRGEIKPVKCPRCYSALWDGDWRSKQPDKARVN